MILLVEKGPSWTGQRQNLEQEGDQCGAEIEQGGDQCETTSVTETSYDSVRDEDFSCEDLQYILGKSQQSF